MTARALELIAAADVVLHDRLIPPGALDGARDDAELVYVGKAPGVPSVPQEEIDERLIAAAPGGAQRRPPQGRRPVRLRARRRGGRGAARGGRRLRGRPRRHRRRRRARLRRDPGHPPRRRLRGRLRHRPRGPGQAGDGARLGGARRLPGHARLLHGRQAPGRQRGGADRRRPRRRRAGAAVERGTMEGQRTVTATLGTLADAVASAGIGAPALMVVGSVVGRRESLAWLERRPLHGRRVVVTRARAQRKRPRRDAARARRRGDRAAGDQDRAAHGERGGAGRDRRDPRLRARLPDQPQRRPPAVRGACGGRARRPGAGQGDRRGDRAGTVRELAAPRDRRRHRPRALRRRVADRGAGQDRGRGPARAR